MNKDRLTKLILFTAGLAMGSCAPTSVRSQETVINVNQQSQQLATVLKGPDYEIRQIGTNVFKFSGKNDQAIGYISTRCQILSTGLWEMGGLYGSYIDKYVATVADGQCIPELK